MNSLEFIKQNIFECKNHIANLEIKITEDERYSTLVKYHKERIEELKHILNLLQQIKTELEAWEVAKKYLILDKEFHQIDLHLHHNTKYKEDYLKLKKALEVE